MRHVELPIDDAVRTLDELRALVRLCEVSGLRPEIDRVITLSDVREGLEAMAAGDLVGKIVVTP